MINLFLEKKLSETISLENSGNICVYYSEKKSMYMCVLCFPVRLTNMTLWLTKIYFFLFKFKLVTIQCSLGFRGRTQWFISYISHPVLIPKSAFLNAYHPFNPFSPPLQQPSVLFSVFRSLLWFTSLSVFILFFLSFPCVHPLNFSNSTYEWNHIISVFLWLISHSIIPSSSVHVVANN